MRQADGTQLLSANDARSASIGIIYVSPNDDRQSVLTAIIIQDKLGRDQIVIVLPEQNRVFRHPIDFDGLKNMRRGMQAQIIFIAPSGPGPAEFARQRRFPVYSSLESFADSLQDESPAAGEDTQRGWLFGRREKARKVDPETPAPLPTETTEDEQTQPLVGGPMPLAEQVPNKTDSEVDDQDDQDIAPDAVDEEEEQEFPPVAPSAEEDDLVPVQMDEEPQIDGKPDDIEGDPDSGVITFHQPSGGTPSNAPAPAVPPNHVYAVRRNRFPYPRNGGGRFRLIAGAVLLLLLIGVYILSRVFFGAPLSATVTITPGSQDLKNTYTVSAVIGTPDPSKHQVQARLLFSTTQAQSKTVNATGTGSIPAAQATGFLTFYNSASIMQSVAADTVFVGTDGVEVVNDEPAVIPAARLPVEGFVTVTAHAVKPGTDGNISALDINGPCCLSGITVRNIIPFGGGQDAQSYSYVQQSDIDSAANTLETSLTQNAQATLQKQIHANEQLAGSPQCQSNVTSDHAASDKAANVTVNVTVACLGEVYDYQGVVSMTQGLLKGEAGNNLGAGYALVGNVVTAVSQTTVGKNETVSLLVSAEGVWVYQFSDAQKKALANLIAGKSQQDAKALLQKQSGVNKAAIQFSQSGANTLPTNPGLITIVTQSVPGVQGTPDGK